ncbi:hypothetical protein [Streptomyces sp. 8N616]|uniref:hypothetical protein n=1 Tax=Streptomyces sp. 8N616 TaxID=3457414 RepID=UPI003FD43ABF
MRTELTDEVPVSRFAAFAEMASLEQRPELGAICRAARTSGGRIAPSVVQQALPGLTDAGAANVVRWCCDLALCDRSGSLTGLGEVVADTDRAPVPEQGVYEMWVAGHPLLGSRLLHVERLTSSRDGRFPDTDAIPVEPDRNTAHPSVVDPQRRFVLRSFPSNHGRHGALRRESRAYCRVTWVLDWTHGPHGASEVRLDGAIDTASGHRPIRHEPERMEIDLWRLADTWALGPLRAHGRWSAEDRRLAVPVARLSVPEQEAFAMTLDLGGVEVTGYGHWSSGAVLSDVPIGPATADDAQAWAMARLDRRLEGSGLRHTRVQVRGLFASVTEDTPLAAPGPILPDHDALLARYELAPEVFWRLAAPVDLAPTPVSQEELGPMSIEAGNRDYLVSTDYDSAVVRVPYRGGWSMRMLLDRLTGDEKPRRLLLVDKYVRGRDNLRSLELLVATLAELGSPALDVWTGNDTDDATAAHVERLTGHRPRRYRQVFGHSVNLHDRYLVVVPERGAPYGWQMTNSPLDARVDDGVEPSPVTPLRWRDLVAARLSVEQLHRPMAAWTEADGR